MRATGEICLRYLHQKCVQGQLRNEACVCAREELLFAKLTETLGIFCVYRMPASESKDFAEGPLPIRGAGLRRQHTTGRWDDLSRRIGLPPSLLKKLLLFLILPPSQKARPTARLTSQTMHPSPNPGRQCPLRSQSPRATLCKSLAFSRGGGGEGAYSTLKNLISNHNKPTIVRHVDARRRDRWANR